MKAELDKRLVEDFPILYRMRNGSITDTCMSWGFECDDGWYELIYELSEKLEEIARSQPKPAHFPLWKKPFWYILDKIAVFLRKHKMQNVLPPPVFSLFWGFAHDMFMPEADMRLCADQVKEKFGTLRFYTNMTNDEIDEIIVKAEQKSATICEACGKPGTIDTFLWKKALCKKHRAEWNNARKLNYISEV